MGYTRRQVRGRGRTHNEVLFPKKAGVEYSKLQMTEEGEYSITKRRDGEKIIEHMKSIVKNLKAKSITDMTGNVGGDTILFGLNFKKVHSYEINPDNFKVLQNNVEVFKLKNVELYQGDSVKAMGSMDTDVVYIDAPWGGLNYKEKENLDLYLGKYRVDEIAATLLEKYEHGPDYVFLKVPSNYNFARLDDTKLTWQKFKIRSFYLVCLFQNE